MVEEQEEKQHSWTPQGTGIPAEVLFNPTLTDVEKLLFSFLQNLSKSSKGCYATNYYLSTLIFRSEQTVSNSIAKLKQMKYIKVVFLKKDKELDKGQEQRHIYIDLDYKSRYKELVEYFYDNYQRIDKKTLYDNLYSLISKLIPSYKGTYNKKEIIKENILKESFSKEKDKGFPEENLISDNSNDISYKEDKFDRSVYKDSLQKPLKPLPKSNPDVDSLIQYWETIGLRKTRKIPGNHSYENNILWIKKAIAGTAFNDGEYSRDWKDHKFTIEEIKQSMKRFSLSARDPDYEPSNMSLKQHLKSYSISQFFYNEMSKNGNKSFFLKFLKMAPPKSDQSIQPKKIPERFKPMIDNIVSVYKKFYEKKVLAGMRVNLNQRDENNFVTGAMKLNDFIADNQMKLPTIKNDREMAMWVCEAIWNSVNEDATKISTTRFASDHTYKTLLPGILVNIGVIHPDYDIYDY